MSDDPEEWKKIAVLVWNHLAVSTAEDMDKWIQQVRRIARPIPDGGQQHT